MRWTWTRESHRRARIRCVPRWHRQRIVDVLLRRGHAAEHDAAEIGRPPLSAASDRDGESEVAAAQVEVALCRGSRSGDEYGRRRGIGVEGDARELLQ